MSALFKDGTIGGNINIALVALILLEEEQVSCLWYQQLFPLRRNNCKITIHFPKYNFSLDSFLLFPLRTEMFWYCVSNTVSFLSVPIMLIWLLFVIFVWSSKTYPFAWLNKKMERKSNFKIYRCIFIYLATLVLVEMLSLLSSLQCVGFFSCGLRDLDSWPETEPRSRALRAWSFSHWTTLEVPRRTTVNTWVGNTLGMQSASLVLSHREPRGWRWGLLLEDEPRPVARGSAERAVVHASPCSLPAADAHLHRLQSQDFILTESRMAGTFLSLRPNVQIMLDLGGSGKKILWRLHFRTPGVHVRSQ